MPLRLRRFAMSTTTNEIITNDALMLRAFVCLTKVDKIRIGLKYYSGFSLNDEENVLKGIENRCLFHLLCSGGWVGNEASRASVTNGRSCLYVIVICYDMN